MQFIADIVGLPITAASLPDYSPLGAAMAGMVGMGMLADIGDLARLSLGGKEFRPLMPREKADAFYAGWKRAVKQVLSADA